MTNREQPKRWLEKDDEWRSVASGLKREAQAGPSELQMSHMLATLSAQITAEAPVVATEIPKSSTPEAKTRTAKLLKLGALLTLAGLVGVFFSLRNAESVRTKAVPTEAVPTEAVPTKEPTPEPTAPVVPTVEKNAREVRVAPTPKVPSRATKRAPEPVVPIASEKPSVTNPGAELALLVRARRVLLADPARTLQLTQEHSHDYPRGAFAEEREVLTVEALVLSGKKPEAADRVQRFIKLFPTSTHTAHLQSLTRSP